MILITIIIIIIYIGHLITLIFSSFFLRSWYKNSKGINFILWPVNLLQYWWMTRVPDLLNDFKLTFDKAYYDL